MRILWLPKWVISTWCKQTRSTSLSAFNRKLWMSGNTYSARSFKPRGRETTWWIEDRWNVSNPWSFSWFLAAYALLFSLLRDHLLIAIHLLFPAFAPSDKSLFFISFISFFLKWIIHSTAQNTGAEGTQEEHLVLHSHLVVDNKIANEKSLSSTPCIRWTMNKLCRHCYKRPSVKNKMMTFTGIKHLESHHYMSNGP